MTDDLIRKDTTELASLISSRQVSPVELTEACLRRIDALNPTLNAFLTVCGDEAMESAREAENSAGLDMPPLHGIPVAVKDLEATKGIRTTFGSLAFKDNVPDEDSIIVERLRKAGAIILGKTNTPEFGQSTSTENRLGDDCRNPWDTGRTSGGSSGGSGAALAAYICPLATGSDGGRLDQGARRILRRIWDKADTRPRAVEGRRLGAVFGQRTDKPEREGCGPDV